jgi:voltage-gated sodium channel
MNNACLYVFILECALKLLAFGPRYFFFVEWNRFDFFIIVISVVTISNKLASELKFNLTVMRIIRVARLLRLIKAST